LVILLNQLFSGSHSKMFILAQRIQKIMQVLSLRFAIVVMKCIWEADV